MYILGTICRESMSKPTAVGRNNILYQSLLQQSWRNLWLKTLVLSIFIHICPLCSESKFFFQQAAVGATEQSTAQKQSLSVC